MIIGTLPLDLFPLSFGCQLVRLCRTNKNSGNFFQFFSLAILLGWSKKNASYEYLYVVGIHVHSYRYACIEGARQKVIETEIRCKLRFLSLPLGILDGHQALTVLMFTTTEKRRGKRKAGKKKPTKTRVRIAEKLFSTTRTLIFYRYCVLFSR